jgi:hypothetical protein
MRAPLTGGAAAALTSGGADLGGIAIDSGFLYFTDAIRAGAEASGTIQRVPLGGGAPMVVVSGQIKPLGIVVDARGLYWANSGANSGMPAIMSAPLANGAPRTLFAGTAGDSFIPSIVADSTAVYWVDSQQGSVMKIGK